LPTAIKAAARRAVAFFGPTGRVRFARARALFWVVFGAASIPFGWADSVALVWMASVYANIESGVAAGEAADDKAVTDRLDRLEASNRRLLEQNERLFALLEQRLPGHTPEDTRPDP
jgi:hypothetical protein